MIKAHLNTKIVIKTIEVNLGTYNLLSDILCLWLFVRTNLFITMYKKVKINKMTPITSSKYWIENTVEIGNL